MPFICTKKYEDQFPFLKEVDGFHIALDNTSIHDSVIYGKKTVEQLTQEIEEEIINILKLGQFYSDNPEKRKIVEDL